MSASGRILVLGATVGRADTSPTRVERSGEPVVLVAHSYAGAVASGVVRLVPERVAHGIWLAGAVLEPGQRLYDLMPPEAQEMIEAQAREGGGRVPFMSPELLDAYFGAHGLDTDDGGWERRDLPTGHWPMRTLPQRTAALIDEVATATR